MHTAWHLRLLLRALVGSLLAFGLVLAISALTDEGGLSLAVRLGRAAPMTPFAAALGVAGALAPLRSRGELVAFAALGEAPTQTIFPAVVGGAIVAAIASIMLVFGWIDVHGFFPVVPKSIDVVWDGASFVDKTSGARVLASGDFGDAAPITRAAVNALPRYATSIAAIATFLSALALSALAAHARWITPARATLLFATMALLLVGFQASATARVSSGWTLAPAFALLAIAARAYLALDAFVSSRKRELVAPSSRRGR